MGEQREPERSAIDDGIRILVAGALLSLADELEDVGSPETGAVGEAVRRTAERLRQAVTPTGPVPEPTAAPVADTAWLCDEEELMEQCFWAGASCWLRVNVTVSGGAREFRLSPSYGVDEAGDDESIAQYREAVERWLVSAQESGLLDPEHDRVIVGQVLRPWWERLTAAELREHCEAGLALLRDAERRALRLHVFGGHRDREADRTVGKFGTTNAAKQKLQRHFRLSSVTSVPHVVQYAASLNVWPDVP